MLNYISKYFKENILITYYLIQRGNTKIEANFLGVLK